MFDNLRRTLLSWGVFFCFGDDFLLKGLISFWNNILIRNWEHSFPIIISIFSLLIATRSFNTNRAKIKFIKNIARPYYYVKAGQLILVPENNKKKVLNTFPTGILFHVAVLNFSPKDVAYFNIHCEIDKDFQEIYTMKSFGYFAEKDKIVIFRQSSSQIGEIPIPNEPQGKFEANSLTPLYGFVRLDDYLGKKKLPKKVTFKISYALKKWYLPFRLYSTKRIIVKGPVFNSWLIEQQLMKQLKKEEKTPGNSRKTPPYNKKRRRNKK